MATEPWRPGAIGEEERAERDKGPSRRELTLLEEAAVFITVTRAEIKRLLNDPLVAPADVARMCDRAFETLQIEYDMRIDDDRPAGRASEADMVAIGSVKP